MNCPDCSKELSAPDSCSCGWSGTEEKPRPAAWVLILILLTGALAIATIWTRPNNDVAIERQIARASELIKSHSYEEAIGELRIAADNKPKRADIRLLLAQALAANEQRKDAVQELSIASKLAPDDYGIQQMYAESLEDEGRSEEALKQYLEVIKRFPLKAEPHKHAAHLLERAGKPDGAARHRQKAEELERQDGVQ